MRAGHRLRNLWHCQLDGYVLQPLSPFLYSRGLLCLASLPPRIHHILSRPPFVQPTRVTIFAHPSHALSLIGYLVSYFKHSSPQVPTTLSHPSTPRGPRCCRPATSAITYETPRMISCAISTTRSHYTNLGSRARLGDFISVFIVIPLSPKITPHLLSHISPVAFGHATFDTSTKDHLARVPGDQPRVTVGTCLTFEAWPGSLFICHPRSFEAPFLPRFIRYLARSLSRLKRLRVPHIYIIYGVREGSRKVQAWYGGGMRGNPRSGHGR
jgi:hypothetical protein